MTGWWDRLRVRQKVWLIVLSVLVPLIAALAVEVSLINHLLGLQQQDQQTESARYHVASLRRLAVDIEDGFRGYLLTGQDVFLKSLEEAEPKLSPSIAKAERVAKQIPGLSVTVRETAERLHMLLESKKGLVGRIRDGHREEVLAYVRSGNGLVISDALREDFRKLEDRLDQQSEGFESNRSGLARQAFNWLLLAVGGTLVLGLLGVRLLTRSITRPIATVQRAAESFGTSAATSNYEPMPIEVRSSDEIGQLARSFERMARQVHQQILELEALGAIGHEINAIGPDGLYGVLRRITDRAAELLQADVCLVLLRDDKMGCWIVEAASGTWHDRLSKSVMLWEELPVSVQAFETRKPVIGEDLRNDLRPEVVRRNLVGESMMALPLIYQGAPFGVLTLLRENGSTKEWNESLAVGFAAEAAMAISNARLYEVAHTKEKGLESRLRQLEHLAESLAHDLCGPGERIEGLAALLAREYGKGLDDRANRWLQLLIHHGQDLVQRVEDILTVARVGRRGNMVEAVDPRIVLEDVLKARAGELEQRRARVCTGGEFPLVACHRAYLRQVFDNLISNAVKFSGERPDFEIQVTAKKEADRLCISVEDNGIGVPADQRERVFDPFVRLNPTNTKGSGIGLAIIKRIVELYDGSVFIDPNDRGGCSVRFTLPLLGELTNPDTRPSESRIQWSET